MVVSRGFPPRVGGSAILLANLLRDYPGRVSAAAGFSRYNREDAAFIAPCPTAYLEPPRIRMLELACDRFVERFSSLVRAFLRRQVRRRRPDIIMGAFPVVDFFVPAYQSGIPFYAHMHDLWEENYPNPASHRARMAARWERQILTSSRRVLCMTAMQRELYTRKYGITPDLLPHTIPTGVLAHAPTGLRLPTLSRPTALFVGACSEGMNLDALRVLAKAADLLPPEYDVLMCTSVSRETLAQTGVSSPRVQVHWKSRSEVLLLQSAVHVLIAPLSHKNGAMEEVRTVFSTKLLEYLISGRPILVFAPADSFHARSAREGGWGLVVDEDSPEALAQGIQRLTSDQALATAVVRGALAESRRRESARFASQLHEWVCNDSGRSSIRG
jgi:glycosyltransferase involved in cell wall biosynthesis